MEERPQEARNAQASSLVSDDFHKSFRKWLHETAGISERLLDSLDKDDDWTFVIKMHGILEAALNHLILNRLNLPVAVPDLEDIISRLETNDQRRGKIAFIKAYDLLPHESRMFVRVLSEIRNRAVHDIKNFDLDLVTYIQGLTKEQKQNWKIALTSWYISGTVPQHLLDFSLTVPRNAIFNSCITILIRTFHTQPSRLLEAARKELLSRLPPEIAESMPKE